MQGREGPIESVKEGEPCSIIQKKKGRASLGSKGEKGKAWPTLSEKGGKVSHITSERKCQKTKTKKTHSRKEEEKGLNFRNKRN